MLFYNVLISSLTRRYFCMRNLVPKTQLTQQNYHTFDQMIFNSLTTNAKKSDKSLEETIVA
jgi:hypothetical protein